MGRLARRHTLWLLAVIALLFGCDQRSNSIQRVPIVSAAETAEPPAPLDHPCRDYQCRGRFPSSSGLLSIDAAAIGTRQCALESLGIWDADFLPAGAFSEQAAKALAAAVDSLGPSVCPDWFHLQSVRENPPLAVFGKKNVPNARVFEFRYYLCRAGTFPHGPHSQDVRVWISDESGGSCVSVGDVRLAL